MVLWTLCDIVLYSVYVCVVGVDSVAVVFRTGFAVVCERWTCVPRGRRVKRRTDCDLVCCL